jgi:hypothetical protein
LEAGIGLGALLSAEVYHNNAHNFVYAFILPAVVALLAMVLLWLWRKQNGKLSGVFGV